VIELAPHHKTGLSLASPVMIAAGFGGYGNAYLRWLNPALFGAIVTGPITLAPERGTPPPRAAETGGGFILNTGQQNPGVKKVLQRYRAIWARLGCPVMAHLPAAEPRSLGRTAAALTSAAGMAAFELGLPADALPDEVFDWTTAIREAAELPLLVKIPFMAVVEVAAAAVEAGADALVVSMPPPGAAQITRTALTMLHGQFFGPALHPLILPQIEFFGRNFNLPIVGSGGIHSLADAQAFLTAGAMAVQLDSVLFADLARAEQIAQALASA